GRSSRETQTRSRTRQISPSAHSSVVEHALSRGTHSSAAQRSSAAQQNVPQTSFSHVCTGAGGGSSVTGAEPQAAEESEESAAARRSARDEVIHLTDMASSLTEPRERSCPETRLTPTRGPIEHVLYGHPRSPPRVPRRTKADRAQVSRHPRAGRGDHL